jgi:putative peptide zinc metalloprotease protein
MHKPLHSSNWYRVAGLRPRLRPHARIHRHGYRGETWYVVQDESSGRYHRYSELAHFVIGLIDGRHTVQEIWDTAVERLGEDHPTQDEVIELLGQLHAADLLQTESVPDTGELTERYGKKGRQKWIKRFSSPLALRFRIFDPEPLLQATIGWIRPLFGWAGFLVWLSVVVAGASLAVIHWTDLTENIIDRVLSPANLMVLWLSYPLVKAVHELGHAYAVKVWGGEVHEMGIMLLVFMPVPYVDASAASAFRQRRQRMVVSGIGIMVELFLASVALLVWLNAESGAARVFAWNVMLIGGVSTLLFNGNPLLRFDGYYVLADAVEIPNLATRANKYWAFLFQRRLFGVKSAESPALIGGESGWFTVYGALAFFYRLFITFSIALFVASKFFVIGVVLAIWGLTTQLLVPAGKMLKFLLAGKMLQRKRGRALAVSGLLAAFFFALLFVAPLPLHTMGEGVIWVPERAHVRTGVEGQVVRLLVQNGSVVGVGDPLVELEAPFLDAKESVNQARVDELVTRLDAVRQTDRVEAGIIKEQLAKARADLLRVRTQREDLTVRAPVGGRLVVPRDQDLPGRLLRQGDLIGYVLEPGRIRVRAAVGQDDIGLIRERTRAVEVRLADRLPQTLTAEIDREVPAASDKLPSGALGTGGGGNFVLDPSAGDAVTVLQDVFQLDLLLAPEAASDYVGGRVYVRFDHGTEPLAIQWYRDIKQLFLRRFGV